MNYKFKVFSLSINSALIFPIPSLLLSFSVCVCNYLFVLYGEGVLHLRGCISLTFSSFIEPSEFQCTFHIYQTLVQSNPFIQYYYTLKVVLFLKVSSLISFYYSDCCIPTSFEELSVYII